MNRRTQRLVLLALALVAGCAAPSSRTANEPDLAGAWRAHVSFNSGAFAPVKDLEFLYVFNAGGTMTESSNHDGAPPVPPAYGVWKRTGPNRFEAKYLFFATKPPGSFDEIKSGNGWLPAGRGVITETISISADGQTFSSTVHYEALDAAGKTVPGGGDAAGQGERIGF